MLRCLTKWRSLQFNNLVLLDFEKIQFLSGNSVTMCNIPQLPIVPTPKIPIVRSEIVLKLWTLPSLLQLLSFWLLYIRNMSLSWIVIVVNTYSDIMWQKSVFEYLVIIKDGDFCGMVCIKSLSVPAHVPCSHLTLGRS